VIQANEIGFIIPTYRLRDVGEAVEAYDEHFWRNGHSPTLIICDDSSPAAVEKYYSLLEQTTTHSELFYVGPREQPPEDPRDDCYCPGNRHRVVSSRVILITRGKRLYRVLPDRRRDRGRGVLPGRRQDPEQTYLEITNIRGDAGP
jgi:hypothetical protein